MTAVGNRGGGRRSKGERRFFGTRLPMDQADLLMKVAPAQGVTISDFIAATLAEKLEPLTREEQQGAK